MLDMPPQKKLALINASNLHVGGGVQVATSFIYELSVLELSELSHLHILVSSEVSKELSRINIDTAVFGRYEVFDNYGLKAFTAKINKEIKKYDVVFTVFGPNYFRSCSKNEIVGFAQLWLLNFNNPVSKKMPFMNKCIFRIKLYIQWLFFLRADHYIVELEHVKSGLISHKSVDSKKISVVYNTAASLYQNKEKWQSVAIRKGSEALSLGIVTRDYPHKNIKVFPLVAEALMRKHDLKVRFYTTLNEAEWATKNDYFKKHVATVGSLSPDQCPSFYEQMDGVVFPSLLECFSATPLEAMVMKKPLFASDRGFVRDVCNDHATYFDPLDADDIALKIATYFKSEENRTAQLEQARDHALNFSSAKGRAEKYLEIIKQHLKG